MKGTVFFSAALALFLSFYLMAPSHAEAKYKWRQLKITEVFVSCDTDDQCIEISGKNLDYGRGPLTVVLGEYGKLDILGDPTEESILVEAPPGMFETPGDFVLTVRNGWGFRQRDEWNLTIGAVGPGAFDQAKLDAIINIVCDDGNECTTDGIDTATGQCIHTWPECGIKDGCCGPGCTSENDIDCRKIVFVTSQTFTGALGGVAGADEKCQSAAGNAGLTGTFLAWIADDTPGSSPEQRFTKNGSYILVDGTVIADSWMDLTDGSLLNAINKDESGVVRSDRAWANVKSDGSVKGSTSFDIDSCYGWRSGSAQGKGRGWLGISKATGPQWTDGSSSSCQGQARLYCFEQ